MEKACRIVTEDFIYPRDRHGHEYGWGWSLLITPESLFGKEACHIERTPEESRERMVAHFREILPDASDMLINEVLRK